MSPASEARAGRVPHGHAGGDTVDAEAILGDPGLERCRDLGSNLEC